jgi:hypothetical protein
MLFRAFFWLYLLYILFIIYYRASAWRKQTKGSNQTGGGKNAPLQILTCEVAIKATPLAPLHVLLTFPS